MYSSFDQNTEGGKKNSTLSDVVKALPPMLLFVSGIVAAFLLMTTAGFFLMLPNAVKAFKAQNGFVAADANTAQPTVAAAPTPSQAPTAQAPTGTVPPVSSDDHVRGSGSLTWIEYSDFECPFCKRFHPTVLQMLKEYNGKVKLVYRHFPLSFHQNAQKEAEASECAGELGGTNAFWSYADKIYDRTTSNGTGFSLDNLVPLAKEIGLNETKFKTCLDSGKYAAKIQQQQAGGEQAGINGTPGSFLVGRDGKSQLVSGALPYDQIKTIIDAALK